MHHHLFLQVKEYHIEQLQHQHAADAHPAARSHTANKTDRMPRANAGDLRFLRSRYAARVHNKTVGVHGVSAHTGAGLEGLAQLAARGADALQIGGTLIRRRSR